MGAKLDVRPSPIAGQWYPGEARRLAAQVDQYMNEAKLPEISGQVVAVMAPHAGHLYSGPVAGYAFAALRGLQPGVVAVVSPMHYPYAESLLTTAHSAYATPLGAMPVEHGLIDALDMRLQAELGFGLKRIANDMEHSLEIELPFLQRALSQPFQLLPIMVRDQRAYVAQKLGEALAAVLSDPALMGERSVLLVASTDLSHFYSQDIANRLDNEMLRQVGAFDPLGVMKTEDEGKGFACGRGALAAVLWAAKALGADRSQVVQYATSGDVTGDYGRVVGYGAAVITRPV